MTWGIMKIMVEFKKYLRWLPHQKAYSRIKQSTIYSTIAACFIGALSKLCEDVTSIQLNVISLFFFLKEKKKQGKKIHFFI
jgi:hypothetical protein